MDLLYAINSILENDSLDSGDIDSDKCEHIENLIPLYGWKAVQKNLLDILSQEKREIRDYEVVAEVFWGAVLDRRNIASTNKVIALLYHRLPNDKNSDENNLAWSIACKLKKVDYLSDYNPMNDSEIIEELNLLR